MQRRLFLLLLLCLFSCIRTFSQTFSPTTLPNGTAEVYYSQNITANDIGSVSYCSISSGTWPYFMTISGTGSGCNISSSNPQVQTFSFTVTAMGTGGQQAFGTYTLTFTSPLVITTSALPGGLQGSGYSQTLGASGGTGSGYSWSVISGNLPNGLSLSTSGVISGTPSAAGTFNFTVQVRDSGSNMATQALSMAITSSLSITSSSLPGGYVGASYSASLAASGGTPPYSWAVISGTFPLGLSLAANGAISGTPTTTGTYGFTVRATDSASGSATAALSISIGAGISITTTSLPSGPVGSAYSASIGVTGGSGSYGNWGIWAGADPPGVSYGNLSAHPLTLSGTPTTAGTYNVTWAVCDALTSACASQAYSITIGAALSISTNSAPNGKYGVGYSQSFSASGGTPGYTWAIVPGSLPNGLTLSDATISGTPTASGTFNFTVQATDSTSPTHQTATKALSIYIDALPSVSVDTASASGQGIVDGSATVQTFGTGYSFSGWAAAPDAIMSSVQVKIDGTAIGNGTYGTNRSDVCALAQYSGWPGCPNVGFTYSLPASSYSLGSHTLSFVFTDANSLVTTVNVPITIFSTMSVTTSSLPNALITSSYSQTLAATGGTSPYTWSIASGSLPSGFTLSSAGLLSGTPTASGTFNFTAQATDTASPTHQTASKAFSLLVNSLLTITTSSLPNGLATTAYSQNLSATGGTPSYIWSLASGALPSGLSLNTSGNIFGTPTTAGTSTFTVQVTDNTTPTQQSATKALSITIGPALAISTSTLPNGLATAPYSRALVATGGTSPYTWVVSSGGLPTGLSLSTAGVISGTPTTGGTYNFAVTATDTTTPTAQTATASLSITVMPAFSIVTTTLPGGVANSSYTQPVSGNGGTPPYSWTVTSGTLPPGLTLSGGTIAGTPTTAGTYNFTVKGSDSSTTTQSATQPLSIAIGAALTITTTSVPNALASSAYSQLLAATGGTTPYAWTLSSGALPSGLTLTSSGAIYGTPNVSGTFNFTAQVTDGTTPTPESVSKPLTLTVGPALTINTSSLPAVTVGTAYSQTLTATGGTSPYTWAIASGTLPPALSLTTAGVISGTPITAGLYTFVVKATDTTSPTAQTATAALGINTLAVLGITTAALPNGLATTAYSQSLVAAGGTSPYTWSVTSGSVPAGLSLAANGLLSGTPTAAGSSTFTVKVTDITTPTPMTASQSYTVTIGPALAVTTASLPNALAGSAYAQVLAASGGTTPYTWSLPTGTLPAGLTLTPGGTIAGIPTAAGTSTFTVKATDSTSPTAQTATKSLSITVTPALAITTTSLSNGLATTPYSQNLAASGGTSPYTWTITSGAFPSGLRISAAGAITGTPTVSGTFSFVVQATDSTSPNAQTASQALSITLGDALLITTQSLNAATAMQAYSQTLSATGGTPPYSWTVASGQLLAGISLSGNTLSGTPTVAGTSSFTIEVTDSTDPTVQTATVALSLTVQAAFGVITTSPLQNGLGGTAYMTKIEASGGTPPYTFTLASGALPAGLTLQSDGTLFGTPTTAGTTLFSVLASDSTTPTVQTQIKPFSLTITPPLSITTSSLPNALRRIGVLANCLGYWRHRPIHMGHFIRIAPTGSRNFLYRLD